MTAILHRALLEDGTPQRTVWSILHPVFQVCIVHCTLWQEFLWCHNIIHILFLFVHFYIINSLMLNWFLLPRRHNLLNDDIALFTWVCSFSREEGVARVLPSINFKCTLNSLHSQSYCSSNETLKKLTVIFLLLLLTDIMVFVFITTMNVITWIFNI